MTQKTTANNERIAARSNFLAALYPNVPDKLWLELRCIHPDTGEVRSFWAQQANDKQRESMLKQADKLNGEGYGVYFAPCLRREKKGSAVSAALVPALWVDVDCDGDQSKRDQELAKLREFEPAPSVIIDSGGGWHGYWLLNEPFQLDTDEDKQRIAHMLHGLFHVLDGDGAYVKSVASVMRLPDSINTKPDRNGATVSILELNPNRRYMLDQFTRLVAKPLKVEKIGRIEVVTLNGHHPLPPRTEQYLASGASNGNRNTELFAAACQMRDAGHSQAETEHHLVPRHLASGSTEREALATIKSAYNHPARDPIAEPKEYARQVIGQLVERFEVEQKTERPTTSRLSRQWKPVSTSTRWNGRKNASASKPYVATV